MERFISENTQQTKLKQMDADLPNVLWGRAVMFDDVMPLSNKLFLEKKSSQWGGRRGGVEPCKFDLTSSTLVLSTKIFRR